MYLILVDLVYHYKKLNTKLSQKKSNLIFCKRIPKTIKGLLEWDVKEHHLKSDGDLKQKFQGPHLYKHFETINLGRKC